MKSVPCKIRTDRDPSQQLDRLLAVCRGGKQARLIKLLWQQDALTHELGVKFGCKSNNHHNYDQQLNEKLIPLGWVIAKYVVSDRCQSWLWKLQPVHVALQKKIHPNLRDKILRLMGGAANDE